MLRFVALKPAALAAVAALLWACPANADNIIGGACSTGGGSARSADGNNEWCNGSTWQYPAYQFGSTSASCTAANAGQVQWTGTLLQACDGNVWNTLGFASSGIYLGTTTTSTNPQRSGDAGTGLLSPTTTSVAIATGGAEALRVTSSGYVGIGSSNPQGLLDVNASSGTTGISLNGYITDYANLDYNGMNVGVNGSHNAYLTWRNSLNRGEIGTQGWNYPINIDASTIALQSSSTGLVGIGTTTPSARLEVIGPSGIGDNIIATIHSDRSTGGNAVLNISNDDASDHQTSLSLEHTWYIGNSWGANTSNDLFIINPGTASTPVFFISTANNVGIGTITPAGQLDVESSSSGYTGYFNSTTTNSTYGIYSAVASTSTGAAIYGKFTGSGNTGYAGYLTNTSTGVANYGLYASTSSTSGYAGYFQGAVAVNGALQVVPPSTETIAAAATVTANACGSIKPVTATTAVSSNTTNTFTAPTTAYAGCCMDVINVGTTNNITLKANTRFKTAGAADQVLTPYDAVRVCSDGTNWYQMHAVSANQ